MRQHLKRNLLLGVALAAVTVGVIIAVGSGGAHHKTNRGLPAGASTPGDVQLAAEYLGVSRSELRRRLRTGESMSEIAESTKGKSADGLIAALLAHRQAALAAGRPSPAAEHEALARARKQIVAETDRARGHSGTVGSAAAYLGLSESALRARLRSGRSLAEIAVAEGKSRAGLIAALIAVKATRLHMALAEHAISATEEKTALGTLHGRVARSVDSHLAAPAG